MPENRRYVKQASCPDYDHETNECIRRFTSCTCNPPRCYVCGRFSREWGANHPACEARIAAEEEADLRSSVESQGLIGC